MIKHTAVPEPWPMAFQSPLFDAPARCGSVSSISSRHYRVGPSDGARPHHSHGTSCRDPL